jgi:hypothetical protein
LYKLDLVNSIVDFIKTKVVLCRGLLPILAVVSLVVITTELTTTTTTMIQNANAAVNASDKPGNVVNSKYLSITDHRYRSGQFSDTITGTIANNSTQEISPASVYAALYDKDSKLITVESGSVSVSSLRAGDNSPFTINIFSGVKDDIDHYTIFPAGTPS